MAYDRYVTEMKDKNNLVYGVRDDECRQEVAATKSALQAVSDCETGTVKDVVTGWTLGRIQTTGISSSNYRAYSGKIDFANSMSFYFDASKYKLYFAAYTNASDELPSQTSNGWITTSPAECQFSSSSYAKIAIQLEETSQNNIDVSTIEVYRNLTYKPEIVSRLEDAEDQIGKINISLGIQTDGQYYSGNKGETISTTSNANSISYVIDLTDYIGRTVCVNFNPYSGSTRLTALCSSAGVIRDRLEESYIKQDGFVIKPDSTYYMLYISVYKTTIVSVSEIKNLTLDIYNLKTGVVFVDADAPSGGDGTENSPFNEIYDAVKSGAEVIRVKPGKYSAFSVTDRSRPLYISLNKMPAFDGSTEAGYSLPKIKIVDSESYYGVWIDNCASVYLSDIWVHEALRHGIYINNVANFELVRCYSDNNQTANFSTFRIDNSNGVIRDCIAWGSTLDGFNIHGYGNTQFINCVAYGCADDGISHHDGCTGLILGGEYYNNGKGGVSSPTFGAQIDISGVYSHDNHYGVYADGGEPASYPVKVKARISNCVLKDNSISDIYTKNSELIGWNNIYDTKNVVTDKDGSLVEFE